MANIAQHNQPHKHHKNNHTNQHKKLIQIRQTINNDNQIEYNCCLFHNSNNTLHKYICQKLYKQEQNIQTEQEEEFIQEETIQHILQQIEQQKILGKINQIKSNNRISGHTRNNKAREAMRLLREQGSDRVEIHVKWPTEHKFETDIMTAYWFVYKIHADSLLHLISSAFKNFLHENITITLKSNNKNLTDYIYWAIWANCEICRKHRKVAGYTQPTHYGQVLRRFIGKRVLFADILFLPVCTHSIKHNTGKYMVLVMASIKTSAHTGKIIHGKIHANVIDDKTRETVIQHVAQFNDHANVGLPDVIWTDRGSEFINEIFQKYAQERNITNIYTPPRTSKSNGVIERIVGLTRQALRSIAGERNITMHEVHDFLDLAIERVNANYFISRLGKRWKQEFWDYCPRIPMMQEMIDISKHTDSDSKQTTDELTVNELAFWKPKTLNKDDPAVKVKIIGKASQDGSHAYLVEQIEEGPIKGINSLSTIHLALRRDLAIIEDNIKERILETFHRTKGRNIDIQTDKPTNDKQTQIQTAIDNSSHILNNTAYQTSSTQTGTQTTEVFEIPEQEMIVTVREQNGEQTLQITQQNIPYEVQNAIKPKHMSPEEYRARLTTLTDKINTFIQTKYDDKQEQQKMLKQLDKEREELSKIWEQIQEENKNPNIKKDLSREELINIINQYKINIIKHPNKKHKRRKRKRKFKPKLHTIWETIEEPYIQKTKTNKESLLPSIQENNLHKINIARFNTNSPKFKRSFTICKHHTVRLNRTQRNNLKKQQYRGGLKIIHEQIQTLYKHKKQTQIKQKKTQYKDPHKDINQQTIQHNDIVLYADKDEYGNPIQHVGKVIKIIKQINKVTYNNLHSEIGQVIHKDDLQTTLLVLQKMCRIRHRYNIAEQIQDRNKDTYQPTWITKGLYTGWSVNVCNAIPNSYARPLCDIRAITHVFKINKTPFERYHLPKFEKFHMKQYQAQFHNALYHQKITKTNNITKHYTIDNKGRITWITRTPRGTLRKMTSQERNLLGITTNLQYDNDNFIDLNKHNNNEKHNQEDQQYVNQLWDEMQQHVVYDIYNTKATYNKNNNKIRHQIKKCKQINKETHEHNIQNTTKELDILPPEEYEYITDNITTKHRWTTQPSELQLKIIEQSSQYEGWQTRYPSIYEIHISDDARQHILTEENDDYDPQEQIIDQSQSANNTTYKVCNLNIKNDHITTDTNNEEKQGVIGLDKKIILTGLHPDDPIHRLVKEAKMKEWMSFKKQKVLTPITKEEYNKARAKDPSAACLPMRWVLEWKIIDGNKSIKARLVAQGTIRKDRREGVLTEVALPNHRALYTMLQWQVTQKHWNPHTSILQGDLKTAFLQAENRSEMVFVTKPKDDGAMTAEDRELIDSMFSKERIPMARAVMTLYGTRDAPANLDMAVRKSLFDRGFKETLTCPNLYRRFTAKGIKYQDFIKLNITQQQQALTKGQVLDSWVFAYVDDLLMGSGETSAAEIAKELQQRWIFKEIPTPPSRFLGISIKTTHEGIFIDQELLAISLKRIISPYIWTHNETLQLPMQRDVEIIHKEHTECLSIKGGKGILTDKKITKYKSLLGILSYLAHTRPDLLYTISFFGQFAAQPSGIALKYLQIACSYAAKTATYGLQFLTHEAQKQMGGDFSRIQQSSEVKLHKNKSHPNTKNQPPPLPKYKEQKYQEKQYNIEVFTDASFKLGVGKAHAGYMTLLNRTLVNAKSTIQKRKAGSSTRAELLALAEAIDNSLAIKFLLLEMGIEGHEITTTVWCDNDNTVTNTNSINPKTSEFQSTFLLRQIYRIIKQGAQIDSMRIIFPRLMDILESHLQSDEYNIINYGDGPMERYRTPQEIKRTLQFYKAKYGTFDTVLDNDMAIYEIIIDKMIDSQIQILHIDGANQLADGLTKMATSIDYVGRVVFDYQHFLKQQPTPIRDKEAPVLYRTKGHRERYDIKQEPLHDTTLIPEDIPIEQWIQHMETYDNNNYTKIEQR